MSADSSVTTAAIAQSRSNNFAMKKLAVLLFALICLTFRAFCADAEYKQVRIETLTNAVRVRLPLTDVTGKVRLQEKSSDDFGLPVAPSKTILGKNITSNGRLATTFQTRTAPVSFLKLNSSAMAKPNTA